jgi:predicted metal-binding protein
MSIRVWVLWNLSDLPPVFSHAGIHQKSARLLLLRRKMRTQIASLEREMFLDGYHKAFGMACGPCNLCKSCDVTEPCRFEDLARPSMEACGIDVYATLANVGYKLEVVKSTSQTCHFCGLVLVD